jgi:hypothetical protein
LLRRIHKLRDQHHWYFLEGCCNRRVNVQLYLGR